MSRPEWCDRLAQGVVSDQSDVIVDDAHCEPVAEAIWRGYQAGRRATLDYLRSNADGLARNGLQLAQWPGSKPEARCRVLVGLLLSETAQLLAMDDRDRELDALLTRAEALAAEVQDALAEVDAPEPTPGSTHDE